jgi:hypothetical protein
MPHAGENHRDAMLVGGGDDLFAFDPVFTFKERDKNTPPFSVLSFGGISFPSSSKTSIRPLANSLRLASASSAVSPKSAV